MRALTRTANLEQVCAFPLAFPPQLPMILIQRCSRVLYALFYALCSAINAATLQRLFTRLPPVSRRIIPEMLCRIGLGRETFERWSSKKKKRLHFVKPGWQFFKQVLTRNCFLVISTNWHNREGFDCPSRPCNLTTANKEDVGSFPQNIQRKTQFILNENFSHGSAKVIDLAIETTETFISANQRGVRSG